MSHRKKKKKSQSREDIVLDSFHSCPSLQGFLSHIPAKSAFLDSSKRGVGIHHCPSVNSYLARFQSLGNSVRTTNIVGENGSAQAMISVVCFVNDILFTREFGNALRGVSLVSVALHSKRPLLLTTTGPKISSFMIELLSSTSANAVFYGNGYDILASFQAWWKQLKLTYLHEITLLTNSVASK